jgi:replication fork clamp-binding protein CrfC
MWSEQWLVAHVSGWVDTDANDDGIIDLTPTSINGSFRMLIPRSSLENWQKIIVNPRAWAVSESILSRTSPVITDENLDHIARETGADDQNNDGIVNYRDLTSIQMKNVTGISQIVPSVSGYIASIHSWNQANKLASLSNIARTENHIVASIIPNPNQADHTPALKLTTVSSWSTILYTLDGSSPVQGWSGTRIANSWIVIPFQNAKLLYREQYNLNGSTVYGKVEQFNLNADWTELSQRKIAYNVNGKATQLIENLSYKNTTYTITSFSNKISSGYVYPKTIDCQVWTKSTDGCQYWPYLAWSPEHEARIRSRIMEEVKIFIDANTVVLPPPNLVDIIRNAISYRWSSYTIKNTYTLDTTNNVRVFPVIIDATVTLKNWQSTTLVKKANNQSELNTYNAQLEQQAKEYIDANTVVLPPPNLVDIIRNAISYRWSSYTIKNTYTLDTTNNVRVFPVIIDATVTLKNWQSTTLVKKANNQSELNTYNAQLEQQAKEYIDANTVVLPPPNLVDIIRNAISYRWSSYTIKNTYTLDTTNNVRVFPVIIDATVTLKNWQSTTLVKKANNQSELNTYNAQLEQQAKEYIDANTVVLPPPNLVDIIRNAISYRWSSYTIKNTYTLDTTNNVRVFPVIIDATVTLKNWQSTTLVKKANNQSELNTYNAQLEQQAKEYIDANTVVLPPPNLVDIIRNAISYRWSSYTIKNTYTLDTTNNVRVFPVIIDATVTLKNWQSTTLVKKANNQSELNTYNAQLEQQAKEYIDANTVVLPPPNLVDIIRNAISYRWSSYTIKNTYTLDTTNNVRVFPVIIDATVTLKNWQSTTLVKKANNQSELNTYNAQLEQQAKEYIDANTVVLPPPNLVDIIRNAISYRWSSYTIKNTYTLDTTNNVRVFPVIIDATVTLKNWQSTTLVKKANNQSELNTYNAQLEQQAKEYIDANTFAFNFSISQENLFSLTKSRITNILPFSSAHADVLPWWWIKVQSSRTQLPPFTSYDSTTVVGKFLWNSSLVDHYVKNNVGKESVGGITQAEIEKRTNDRIMDELQKYQVWQVTFLGDLPENMRWAIENVFLDLGKYIGNLPWLIQKHNTNLINAWVPQSVINNLWDKIATIWNSNDRDEEVGLIATTATVFLTYEGWILAVTPIIDSAWNIITKIVTGPVVNGYTYYRTALLTTLGIGKLWPEIVKLLPAEQAEIQALTKTPDLISKINNAWNIFMKVRDSVNRLVWLAKWNMTTINQAGTWLDHIMLELRPGDALTRYQQIMNNKIFMDWMTKNWWYSVRNPSDLIRLISDVVTKGGKVIEWYEFQYWSNQFIKVVVADNGYIVTVTFK